MLVDRSHSMSVVDRDRSPAELVWVESKNWGGLDGALLNLSYGTDSRQSYLVDPLDYAVERAWFSGILVVVAAGNRGPDAATISKPGDDPYVLTVGSVFEVFATGKYPDNFFIFLEIDREVRFKFHPLRYHATQNVPDHRGFHNFGKCPVRI